jgi:hypothetical protein
MGKDYRLHTVFGLTAVAGSSDVIMHEVRPAPDLSNKLTGS